MSARAHARAGIAAPGAAALAALVALAIGSAPGAAAAQALRATQDDGRIQVHVWKKGLFSGFAHDHHFLVTAWRAAGEVPRDDPGRLSLEAVLAADSLRDQQKALSDSDRKKVDAQAAGPEVLDAARFPEVRWRAQRVELEPAKPGDGTVHGTAHGVLTLRGRTAPVDVVFEAERDGDAWRVRGKGRVKQSAFGIAPFSGFGGTVGVKDELDLELSLTLHPAARRAGRRP